MKEYDIHRALTEVSDELLLEAENAGARKRTIKFHRLIAVAAIIAMLAVTAGAVSAGITWEKNKVSRQDVVERFGGIWEEYYDGPDSMGFEKLELTLPLEVTELPDENMEIIRRLTRQAGRAAPGKEVDFYVRHRNGDYSIPEMPFDSFASLEDVENLLGITLDLPQAVREKLEIVTDDYSSSWVWVRVYARPTGTEGALEPAKLELSFRLDGVATNGQATGTITLALTGEAAREGMLVESYSYESEGAIWQEEQTLDGRELIFFGNAPEAGYDGWAEAVYVEDGIGYCVSARRDADIPHYSPPWPSYDSAKDMVLSLLTGAG